jgi:hypothetical protein
MAVSAPHHRGGHARLPTILLLIILASSLVTANAAPAAESLLPSNSTEQEDAGCAGKLCGRRRRTRKGRRNRACICVPRCHSCTHTASHGHPCCLAPPSTHAWKQAAHVSCMIDLH